MSINSNEDGRWFAAGADQIIEFTWSGDYDSVVGRIDSLEAEAATREAGTAERHEYRRRIAELRLFAAHKRRRPLIECEDLFARRCELGFRTFADEAIETSAHARYCLAIGEKSRALEHAERCLAKGEASISESTLPSEIEAALRDVLRRAKHRR